jgi:DNA-binding CsgD family transcriptional regulator
MATNRTLPNTRENLACGPSGTGESICSAQSAKIMLAGLEALELLGIGWMVCSDSGHVLGTNRTVNDILRWQDGLAVMPDGVLHAPLGCSQPLDVVIRQAAETILSRDSESRGTALTVQRLGKRPLTIFVQPAHGVVKQDHAVPPADDLRLPAALLLILDSTLPVAATDADLHALFGFTPAETRLANLLMEGRALDACCLELGVCRSPARTHLRRMLKKARVSNQSQLVSVLLKSIGIARRPSRRTANHLPPGIDLSFEHPLPSLRSPTSTRPT